MPPLQEKVQQSALPLQALPSGWQNATHLLW
jgi:hypothetical protein